jgi:hypothetical protein
MKIKCAKICSKPRRIIHKIQRMGFDYKENKYRAKRFKFLTKLDNFFAMLERIF